MYLKSLDLFGFKSFAEKTHLDFEPGMTAVVGPNGCGKSNVADAVRWVLGEQRPTMMRGQSMEDCIFNGTDSHKALNMAEVSLTIGDCRTEPNFEYDEVCLTRRVFRSGESQYFLNRQPCRLKDLQRLFMDTGVGTDAYSIIEQGKIDRVLSSRPQDRRAVFEEASGITRFKNDKKEALRKLERTEANLMRLADVIREVKRQIISLQRQAGKARRYQELRTKLRARDIHLSRLRRDRLARELEELHEKLKELDGALEAKHEEQRKLEEQSAGFREQLDRAEQQVAERNDAYLKARHDLERSLETVRVNRERISELRSLAEQQNRESDDAQNRLEEHRKALETAKGELGGAEETERSETGQLEAARGRQTEIDRRLESQRETLGELRNQSMECESEATRLRNHLQELEERDRRETMRRERLTAEKSEHERSLAAHRERREEMAQTLEHLRNEVGRAEAELEQARREAETRREQRSQIEAGRQEALTRCAAIDARLEMIQEAESGGEDYPAGCRALLHPPDGAEPPGEVLGPLADFVRTDPAVQHALEAALRPWLDALVVRDPESATAMIGWLRRGEHGSARLLCVDGPEAPPEPPGLPGRPLSECVTCEPHTLPLLRRLLRGIRLVDELPDRPRDLPAGAVAVTSDGRLVSGRGEAELWMPRDDQASPVARRHLRESLEREREEHRTAIAGHETSIRGLEEEESAGRERLKSLEHTLEESRRRLSVQEGEKQVIDREAEEVRRRHETVEAELEQLQSKSTPAEAERADLRERMRAREADREHLVERIRAASESLNEIEQERGRAMEETTERRIAHAQARQNVEQCRARVRQFEARIGELEELIRNRTEGSREYVDRTRKLESEVTAEEERQVQLRELIESGRREWETAREERERIAAEARRVEQAQRELGRKLEEIQEQRSKHDLQRAEKQMRLDNLIERVTSDWHITAEQMDEEPPPEWDTEETPNEEALESEVAEMRAKLDSMGPVNLVAIEEHRELEERYAFLQQQQQDLTSSKEQMMELIRKINKTSTEKFTETFHAVNANFQQTFKQLFGGGSAKLVLIDEEDVLESGIEIIARPPGKKLQSISLLSGGERTMTAVALLFALYLVKPSPFCLLDELDAALDDANIGRFVKVVKGFLETSQFIVITHNKQTIAASSTIYGVTMPQKGVSRIVSMKFADYEGE
ncbi:chromosome segregation protein SMC [Kiritimatiella glycovorans]|uniref:Chromosome partition protein Smc n=1 Tax=Kiritimatiella glycovorans TaxID=1307763 RepID=A0A0G3EMK6_9BACT|nr:chromosome segregation protein SMC [Kiritimatiella glycovorans]AKJ65339.1 Chromosome partition protein Smc [Kiritimatiella glycovorans]